jgi:hypothetical protein
MDGHCGECWATEAHCAPGEFANAERSSFTVTQHREEFALKSEFGITGGHSLKGLVEDKRETHPQAEAASQLDGVHEGLLSWTAKPRLYLVEKTLFFVSNRRSHFWTAMVRLLVAELSPSLFDRWLQVPARCFCSVLFGKIFL